MVGWSVSIGHSLTCLTTPLPPAHLLLSTPLVRLSGVLHGGFTLQTCVDRRFQRRTSVGQASDRRARARGGKTLDRHAWATVYTLRAVRCSAKAHCHCAWTDGQGPPSLALTRFARIARAVCASCHPLRGVVSPGFYTQRPCLGSTGVHRRRGRRPSGCFVAVAAMGGRTALAWTWLRLQELWLMSSRCVCVSVMLQLAPPSASAAACNSPRSRSSGRTVAAVPCPSAHRYIRR